MIRRLTVWWDERVVGELTQGRHGELGFAYSSEWIAAPSALALSVSLPKRAAPFSRRECRPFFGGLLPEGSQREAAAQALVLLCHKGSICGMWVGSRPQDVGRCRRANRVLECLSRA